MVRPRLVRREPVETIKVDEVMEDKNEELVRELSTEEFDEIAGGMVAESAFAA